MKPQPMTAMTEKKLSEVSRVRLRYPKHLMTIALAHTLTPPHTQMSRRSNMFLLTGPVVTVEFCVRQRKFGQRSAGSGDGNRGRLKPHL